MKYILVFLFSFLYIIGFAQKPTISTSKKTNQGKINLTKRGKLQNPFENKQELSLQFDYLYKKSTSYKEYKVISIGLYNTLKKSVLDSVKSQNTNLSIKSNTINENKLQIKTLQNKLLETQNHLESAVLLKNNRSFFGVPMNKTIFSIIIIVTHFTLFVLLGVYIFKYKNSIGTSRKAVNDLSSLEMEFEKHKKSSLKRFQEVNRKLQDELNKNWKKEK